MPVGIAVALQASEIVEPVAVAVVGTDDRLPVALVAGTAADTVSEPVVAVQAGTVAAKQSADQVVE